MSDDAEICCPFCDSADGCKHLVASFDQENVAIGGGVFLDREEELLRVLGERFANVGPTSDWEPPPEYDELWESYVEQPEEPLDAALVAQLLDALLRDADMISEDDGGIVVFFDRKPAKVYDAIVKAIQKACEPRR
jgi:hypothetical protein